MSDGDEKEIPVKVAIRSRPLLQWEIEAGAKDHVQFISEANQVVVGKNRAFTYDYVFDASTAQQIVYNSAVFPLISGIFKGYNGTVLAYGQTGSGKTYSMGSAHCISEVGVVDDITGIIPRVIKDIFHGIENRKTHSFFVKVSYVEIYKEEVKDLLSNTRDKALNIRENADGSIRIAGLTEALVSNVFDTLQFMERGNCNRSTGSTAMNVTSSRSHAIFTIVLESRCIETPDEITCSKFHLVDLAGSERAKRTKAEGDRFQEGIKINSGLLALGNVISALGEGNNGQHIPYRVSKLTRLLQDSLGGNSLTVMIACISPADSSSEETTNTLRYADRARKIKNKAIVNRDPQTAELVSLRKEIQKLRMQALQSGVGTCKAVEVVRDSPETREQLRKFEEENRQLLQEMQKLVDSNTEMCEKAIATDVRCEKFESKLSELRSRAQEIVDDSHEISVLAESVEEPSHQQCIVKLKELRNKILEQEDLPTSENVVASLATTMQIEEIQDSPRRNDSLDVVDTDEETAVKTEHILRTAKLSNQLQELSKALAMKEDLAKRMCASDETMGEIRRQYDERLKKLDVELVALQNERDGLAAALEAAKKNSESQKISEKRRVRMIDLENQIKELRKEKKEKEKVTKLKAQSDQKINNLHSEIHTIKAGRVKLMRQIKEENAKFQSWKKEKEREVKQLKEKNRKRAYEMVKLERDFNNQRSVLRRKTEEAAASNRRLKEALMKQRLTATRRQQSMSKTLDSANSRMKVGMEEDIEIAVSSKEAKKHVMELEKDLEAMKEQLANVFSKESPNKRRRTYTKKDDELQRRHLELTSECELKEAQIKELQSKLVDAKDARTRQQARLLQITSIAEARSVMKHLFNLVVDSRVAEEACRKEATNLHNQIRTAKAEIHEKEQLLSEFGKSKEADLTAMENAHQEQVLYLTKQLSQTAETRDTKPSSEREADLVSQIKLQASLIEELAKERDNLEAEKKQLKKNSNANGRPSLFQPITEEQAAKTKPKKSTAKQPSTSIDFDEFEVEDVDDQIVSDYDSDYIPTPLLRRTKSRKTISRPKDKCCSCSKNHCKTKVCSCKKAGLLCTDLCRCDRENCSNVESSNNTLQNSNTSSASSDTSTVAAFSPHRHPSSLEEKENTTPYYKRVGTLLNAEASEIPNKAETTSYQPVYFQSPIRDQDQNCREDVDSSNMEATKKDFAKPKNVVGKKRKLHSKEFMFD